MSNQSIQQSPPVAASISPYSGTWNKATAAHLLRRTVYGPRLDEIEKAQRDGLDRTLDLILGNLTVPKPPVKYRSDYDSAVQLGETWVNTPYIGTTKWRGLSLRGWFYNTMILEEQTSIRDKMVFFWLNYFAVHGEYGDHRSLYSYIRLYQELATGNLREMLERITIEPQMLWCLDGNVNVKDNPNENYARELMELYTVGKGELIAKGDYSTFTEKDVVALARALTGWVNNDFRYAEDYTPVASQFVKEYHDTGDKQMSYHFGNVVIRNGGADEYKKIIDILLKSEHTARHFCRRLYRYFVYYEITDEIEEQIIKPLAQTFVANNYEIKPVLRQLLKSQHFYDMELRGAIIKNPIDLLVSSLRPFREYKHVDWVDLRYRYEIGINYCTYVDTNQLEFLQPPTISGWKAYYDSPKYHRHWISPALLQKRYWMVKKSTGRNAHIDNNLLELDLYSFSKSLSNPLNINTVLDDLILLFLPRPITDAQYTRMKGWLLQGASDAVWSSEMSAYLANPGKLDFVRPMEKRYYDFFEKLFGMAEFQLQ